MAATGASSRAGGGASADSLALEKGHFVGRTAQIAALRAAIDALGASGGCVVTVAGEAGIGKTRLIEEALHDARRRRMALLTAQCYEQAPPYQPFVEAIRRYLRESKGQWPAADLGGGAPFAARLVSDSTPELSQSPVPLRAGAGALQSDLFEAISGLLLNVSRARPVALFVDDLHAAQSSSLGLLLHLARLVRDSPVLLICAYRDAEVNADHPLAAVLAELWREPRHERIALEGLSAVEVRELVALSFEQETAAASPSFAEALRRHTRGNPFFIRQLLQALAEEGEPAPVKGLQALDWVSLEAAGVPSGVRETIAARLRRLSPGCNEILARAAVLGGQFELETLRCVAPEGQAFASALQEALAARMLAEVPAAATPELQFSHELVRQAIYESLDPCRRQELHLRAARAIEGLHPNRLQEFLARLAEHYRLAASPADREKGVAYAIGAGEAAEKVFAYDEATKHWQAALSSMEQAGETSKRRADLLARVGYYAGTGGLNVAQGVNYLEQALALYQQLGESRGAARTHARLLAVLSLHVEETMDIDGAIEHYSKAEPVLRAEPAEAALLYLHAAVAFMYALRPGEGLAAARQALQACADAQSRASYAWAAGSYACNLWAAGHLAEAFSLLEEAWEKSQKPEDPYGCAGLAWAAAVRLRLLLDPVTSRQWLQRELFKPRTARVPGIRAWLVYLLATAHALAGELDAAGALQAPAPAPQWWRSGEDRLALYRGAFGRCDEVLTGMIRQHRRAGNLHDACARELELARLCLTTGDRPRAEKLLRGLVSCAGTARHLPFELAARSELALLLAQAEKLSEASGELERCAEIMAAGEDWRGLAGRVMLAEAALLAARGRPEEASQRFSDATQWLRRYQLPWDQAEALRLWGQALAQAGGIEQASAKFEAAAELYRRHGAGRPWIDLVAAEMDRALTKDAASLPTGKTGAGANGRQGLFRREGEYWRVGLDERSILLRDRKGLRYVAVLLRHPETEFSAAQLEQGAGCSGRIGAHAGEVPEIGDAGMMLDRRAIRAYRQRLSELQAALQEAGSPEHALSVKEEIAALEGELARAVGLAGRSRTAASIAERARLNVTRAIRRALAQIATLDPGVGELLGQAIKTGLFCRYVPDPGQPISWRF